MQKVLLSLAVIAASGAYVAIENAGPQANGGMGLGGVLTKAQSQVQALTGAVTTAQASPQSAIAQSTPIQLASPQSPDPVAALIANLPADAPAQPQNTATQSVATASPTPTPAAPPLPRPRPANAPSAPSPVRVAQAGPQDGTYRGPSVNAYYGQVQVAAVVKSGRLQKVEILDYPSDRRRSEYISSVAIPMLEQEAVQAQSANINIISGATLTSEAFIRSLSAALPPSRG